MVQAWLSKLKWSELGGIFGETNQTELVAFTSYALAFPKDFLALINTYDVMRSSVPNFCAVSLVLNDLGYKAMGIRLDSGDLAYLSCESRNFFRDVEKESGVPNFGRTGITASNDLNEETLDALNKQDEFGVWEIFLPNNVVGSLAILHGSRVKPMTYVLGFRSIPGTKIEPAKFIFRQERIKCRQLDVRRNTCSFEGCSGEIGRLYSLHLHIRSGCLSSSLAVMTKSSKLLPVCDFKDMWAGRYEAHLWDNGCKKERQTRKGRQGEVVDFQEGLQCKEVSQG
ncbi:nicotinate phosphoribosyltransferase [Phtheirospermum japonicum]|uniref:nicotinate phosphoribosyltransferase n=1 Tax=Phtheirospermum japonicum TaxID=374723 RepID=A0A830C5I5_9LAMI|nr:nicotinate phosphoribosyltransferase [Phtheirospermum japonicum]